MRDAFGGLDPQERDALIEDVFAAVEGFDGEVQQYEPGTEFVWMAAQRDGEPGLIRPVRWVGTESMAGFEIAVRSGNEIHTFVIPTACCNITLLRSREVPPPPLVDVEVCPSCLGSPVTVRARVDPATDQDVRVDVILTRPDGTSRTLSGTAGLELQDTLDEPGAYTVTAVAVSRCGASEEVTRSFQVPDAEDLRPSLDVTLSGDETGNRVRVTVVAGSELARRVIGETVRPANERERIDQLVEEASLEITLTAEGEDDHSVTLSDAQGTATGVRWDRAFDLGTPGRYTVTAAVKTEWGVCEVSTSFDVRPPRCALSVGAPIPMSDGQARVDIDMCGSSGAVGGSHIIEVRRDGVVLRTVRLSACQEAYVLDGPGLYTFAAVTADSRGIRSTNSCEAQVAWQPSPGLWPFASGFVGLERRWRTNVERDVSAALVGASGGVMFPVAERLGLFGRVGGVVNTHDGRFSSLFADVGADVLFPTAFVGAGVGVWDFTHSDWVEGSFFFHGGVDTPWVLANGTVQWFVEGRLFLGMLDMIDNNYSAFSGLRLIWKGQRRGRKTSVVSPTCLDSVSGARRPDAKARRGSIPAVFDRGATPAGGMPRPETV